MNNLIPKFKDKKLLITALTHRSALNEKVSSAKESNERLEFLGDAVLELCTTKFLFNKLPQTPEGEMTAFRSALVRTETLANVAKKLGLGEELYMSRGEEQTGGRQNISLLANTFEALIGAMYLDSDFNTVYNFLNKNLFPYFDYIRKHNLHRDFKSRLQELVQSKGKPTPIYKVVNEVGPDHDKKFTIAVIVDDEVCGQATGSSKQRAEQKAAQCALEKVYNQ